MFGGFQSTIFSDGMADPASYGNHNDQYDIEQVSFIKAVLYTGTYSYG